jgi:hypothetical protein
LRRTNIGNSAPGGLSPLGRPCAGVFNLRSVAKFLWFGKGEPRRIDAVSLFARRRRIGDRRLLLWAAEGSEEFGVGIVEGEADFLAEGVHARGRRFLQMLGMAVGILGQDGLSAKGLWAAPGWIGPRARPSHSGGGRSPLAAGGRRTPGFGRTNILAEACRRGVSRARGFQASRPVGPRGPL